MPKSLFVWTSFKLECNAQHVERELISDADTYLFFEKGMRGEISYISIGIQ